jgi:hypothetical protein
MSSHYLFSGPQGNHSGQIWLYICIMSHMLPLSSWWIETRTKSPVLLLNVLRKIQSGCVGLTHIEEARKEDTAKYISGINLFVSFQTVGGHQVW